jgi:two-component system sensor histidine kinase BarA
LLTQCLVASFRDVGLTPRVIASPALANDGEIVLTLSELLAKHGGAPGAHTICLTDIGDNHADNLIRSGVAADLLPLPVGRRTLWDFISRATRFEFRGPAALAVAQAAGPTETFGHLSILAVDDNAVNREVLREALLSLGAEGDFVNNGVDAFEAASKKAYDVIFMDGSMPEMDGFTATKLIRHHEATTGKRAFIVALTAQVRGADADAWAVAGADRHMTKPFTSARLTEALKSVGTSAGLPVPAPVATQLEPPREAPLIDDDAVATMEAVGARSGRDVVAKVWKLFLGQAPDAVFKLETFAISGDTASLAKQAHFLKSMALSSGAARLAALCESMETQAKAGLIKMASEVLARVRPELEATCAEMNARLAIRPAKSAG